MEFFRQEHWSELPFPSLGHLPDPGIEPGSPALQADSLLTELWGKPIPRELVVKHGPTHHCLHSRITSCVGWGGLRGMRKVSLLKIKKLESRGWYMPTPSPGMKVEEISPAMGRAVGQWEQSYYYGFYGILECILGRQWWQEKSIEKKMGPHGPKCLFFILWPRRIQQRYFK